MMNTIFLRRKLKVIVPAGQEQNLPTSYIATSLKNLECYGYTIFSTEKGTTPFDIEKIIANYL